MKNIDLNKAVLQNILQYATIGVHVIDNTRKTIIYNSIMAELEGLKVEQVMGKYVNSYKGSSYRGRHNKWYTNIFKF